MWCKNSEQETVKMKSGEIITDADLATSNQNYDVEGLM